jgi:pSer/pThr/pTyr-binding forkhead associated (FHA) protein
VGLLLENVSKCVYLSFSYLKNVGREHTIGRTPNNDIRIDDKLLSKMQGVIHYNKDSKSWYLNDGFENKASTNGTWIYIGEDT